MPANSAVSPRRRARGVSFSETSKKERGETDVFES